MPAADFLVNDQGSIVLFTPQTEEALRWVVLHVRAGTLMFGRAIVVEHRFAEDFAVGLCEDGLTLDGI